MSVSTCQLKHLLPGWCFVCNCANQSRLAVLLRKHVTGTEKGIPSLQEVSRKHPTKYFYCVWAAAAAAAVTPPGFKTSGGATVPCGDNEFRADWKSAEEATTCSSCGKGVYASKTDQIMVYDIENATEKAFAVTSTADDCCKLHLVLGAGAVLLCQCGMGGFCEPACHAIRTKNEHSTACSSHLMQELIYHLASWYCRVVVCSCGK